MPSINLPAKGEADWDVKLNAAINAVNAAVEAQADELPDTVREEIVSTLVAGTNISLVHDPVAGTLTISSTGGGSVVLPIQQSDVTGLVDALADKQPTGDYATNTALTTGLSGKAATSHTHTASQISDATTIGRAVLQAADGPAVRTAIGAGTSSLALGTTSTTAKAGNYQPTADQVTETTTNKVLTATERTKLSGIATAATANSTDAQLRDRSTHTGVQAISTITDLQTTLDAKMSAAKIVFVANVESIPAGTPVDTLVVVRASA